MMTRYVAAAAAVLLAGAAYAQATPEVAAAAPVNANPAGYVLKNGPDQLRIYGLLDLTLGYSNNNPAAGGSGTPGAVYGFREGWFSGSRFGFIGKHQLAEKSNIIYKLEGEFVIPTGALGNGLIFGRDAWLGYEGETIGQITFGRQNTMARDFSQNYGDAYGSGGVRFDEGGWTNTNNFKTLLNYAGSVTGSRFNNGIVWKKGFLEQFMIGAGYQFGQATETVKRNSTAQIGLAWNGGPFNASGFYTVANQAGFQDTSYSVGGNVTLAKMFRVNAGYFGYKGEQPGTLGDRKDTGWTVSAKIAPAEAYDVELGYNSIKVDNAASSATNTPNAFADVSTFTSAANLSNGNRNSLYASAFYHLDKFAEVYVAGDYTNITDTYKVSAWQATKTNQTEIVVGTRFKY